jgi:DNA-directed RNA polymerase subunit M/transcription elongation factor TFIIS
MDSMEFCPKCDTHMEKRIEQNDILVCPKCGFKEENKTINNTDVTTINSPQPPIQSEKTILEVRPFRCKSNTITHYKYRLSKVWK